MTSMKTMSRAIAAIALGGTLTIGSATLAGASGWGHSHDGPSQRAVPFSFSNNGTAVLVGTVSAISGDNITVTDPEGFSRAILVSSTTTYEQGGATSTIAAVVVGAKIFAQGTVDTNGTTLDALSIGVAGGGTKTQMGFDWGVVTAVTSSSVTIEGRSGTSTTFTYATTTPIDAIGHDKITLSSADLVVNEHAGVEFSTSAATTATGIWVELAHIDGVVTVPSVVTTSPSATTRALLAWSSSVAPPRTTTRARRAHSPTWSWVLASRRRVSLTPTARPWTH
jgi:hypothetical protein